MTELLTAAQMKAIEAAAIASGEVTGLELMERAGRGVVEAVFEEWPELRAGSFRAVVLCGPGGNGGDGFVVARLLKEWGWEVEVFLYGTPEGMPPDARVNYERWRGMGEVRDFLGILPSHLYERSLDQSGVLLDALFGTGLSRSLKRQAIERLAEFQYSLFPDDLKKVSVDVPSGLDADSGRFLTDGDGPAFTTISDLCVTFHRPRIGHYLAQGPGKTRVKMIGLPARSGPNAFMQDISVAFSKWVENSGKVRKGQVRTPVSESAFDKNVELVTCSGGDLNKDSVAGTSHKYSHGHAFILSGPSGRGGAARLSARGALRIGAGVVTVGCPLDAIPENAARLDAVMLRGVADGAALAAVLEDQRINALCLGPGMGTGAREAGLVGVALGLSAGSPPPPSPPHQGEGGREGLRNVVLDADALTILSQHPDLFAALHDGCVLTPHAGEFARLFPDIAEKLAAPATKGPAYSKVDATREATARAGCVVLYKGPDTVIAAPDGRCAINSAQYDRAAPWLATAGSGDVLAGFITGLLARGFSPFDAACTGAWLHVECALSFGPGLIAEDLAEELPKVFRKLRV